MKKLDWICILKRQVFWFVLGGREGNPKLKKVAPLLIVLIAVLYLCTRQAFPGSTSIY